MTKLQMLDFPHIIIDDLKLDLQLICSYPVDLAYRFHSFPIAETEDYYTIVMTEPEDQLARAAIQKVCRKRAHVLRGDPEIVDALINKYFPKIQDGRILISCPSDEVTRLDEYARVLAPIMKTEIVEYCLVENTKCLTEEFINTANGYSLVFFSAPESSLYERIIHGSSELRFLERLTTSCLFPRTPRLPIRTIMMLLHRGGSDIAVMDLVARIAALTKAKVIILAVLPQVPTMFQGLVRMRLSQADILQSQTEMGRRLRRISRSLCCGSFHGEIHLKQGQSDCAIQEEIATSEIDLVVTATPRKHRQPFKFEDECVIRMLRWIERPVLLAA